MPCAKRWAFHSAGRFAGRLASGQSLENVHARQDGSRSCESARGPMGAETARQRHAASEISPPGHRRPTDTPTHRPTNRPTDIPTPTDGPTDRPTPTDEPTDGPTDRPRPTDGSIDESWFERTETRSDRAAFTVSAVSGWPARALCPTETTTTVSCREGERGPDRPPEPERSTELGDGRPPLAGGSARYGAGCSYGSTGSTSTI